jgi:integrase
MSKENSFISVESASTVEARFHEEAAYVVNRKNYLWTKQFLAYLAEVLTLSEISVSRYWFHLRHLLIWADETLLHKAESIRPSFQSYVGKIPGKDGKDCLSPDSQRRIIDTARRFFEWATLHCPNEFRKISPGWIDTLKLRKMRSEHSEHEYVTLEEICQLANFPVLESDLALQRDRAAAIMLYLSGMRASAFTTAPIQAFDLENQCVYQWPKEYGVMTKNSKKATTFLLPIPELLEVVKNWDRQVRLALSLTSPWYAPVKSEWGDQDFSNEAPGTNRNIALNKRLKVLFDAAGLPYKSAHKFRHGHAVYGLQQAATMADYKAVSMNLMHEDIRTTDGIYAPLVSDEVKTRIAGLTSSTASISENQLESYLLNLSNDELAIALKIASDRLAKQNHNRQLSTGLALR